MATVEPIRLDANQQVNDGAADLAGLAVAAGGRPQEPTRVELAL